ncbi:aspartate aminotransferase-like enzyme [Elusimicrobium posterum]|uniref:aminotransferase class V-fold PLP-dependent enzyme n=1 Tax=Elusimicrobium posterum TaxID=3116653 RepID=UPI003C76DE2E
MEEINFIPGPATLSADSLAKASALPVPHRSAEFKAALNSVSCRLCALTNANNCVLMAGSGTLANDIVGAQLSLLEGKGLILSNGEFGERLTEQAARFGLNFTHLKYDWGQPFNYAEILLELTMHKIEWLWFAHCETSTGVLNDLGMLGGFCKEHGVKLCVDAISSIGNAYTDFKDVYLATATSGKGLCALPGIAMVFSSYKAQPCVKLPKYLDLGFYHTKDGLPFTLSSNLLYVLAEELEKENLPGNVSYKSYLAKIIDFMAQGQNFKILAPKEARADFVFTLVLPSNINSLELGEKLASHGILIHYKNPYLLQRNWVQVSLMGYTSEKDICALARALENFKQIKTPAL